MLLPASPTRSITTAITASSGISPCLSAADMRAGFPSTSTAAAAAIEPVPASTSARPTSSQSPAVSAMPTPVTTARNRL